MKHYSLFKIVCVCYGCYIIGGFLSAVFTTTHNQVGAILGVAIPTILLLAYTSLAVHSVQPAPAKKRLPVRRASRVASKPRMKVVR